MIPSFQVGVLWYPAIIAVVVSLVFRGALLRMAGLEVVTADGEPVSRAHLVMRSLLMWSPILIAHPFEWTTIGLHPVPGMACLAAIVIMAVGTIASLANQRAVSTID